MIPFLLTGVPVFLLWYLCTDFWGSSVCPCEPDKHCFTHFFRSHLGSVSASWISRLRTSLHDCQNPGSHSLHPENIPLCSHRPSLTGQPPSADKLVKIKVWDPSFQLQLTHPINPSRAWRRPPRDFSSLSGSDRCGAHCLVAPLLLPLTWHLPFISCHLTWCAWANRADSWYKQELPRAFTLHTVDLHCPLLTHVLSPAH